MANNFPAMWGYYSAKTLVGAGFRRVGHVREETWARGEQMLRGWLDPKLDQMAWAAMTRFDVEPLRFDALEAALVYLDVEHANDPTPPTSQAGDWRREFKARFKG